jgi:diguanylate cyclase (GGDEF)-like protein
MTLKKSVLFTAVTSAMLLSYFLSSILEIEYWNSIISPLIALSAGMALLAVFLKASRNPVTRLPLLLCSFACFAWFVSDIVWAIYSFSSSEPSSDSLIWALYSLTNLFLLSSLISFVIMHFSKWNTAQLLVDTIIIGTMTLHCIGIGYFSKDVSMITEMLNVDYTGLLNVICDVLIVVGLLTWGISVRSAKIPVFIKVTAAGLFAFSITDMLYYYQLYHLRYEPNSVIDVFYVLSLSVIAFGAAGEHNRKSFHEVMNIASGRKLNRRIPYLFTGPIILTLLKVTGLFDFSITLVDYAVFIGCILLYWALSKFIQRSIQKEIQLEREKQLLQQKLNMQDETLSYISNRDTMTGLLNRRYFEKTLKGYIDKIKDNELLGVVVLDVDRFRIINDTYGHDVGNRLLIKLSGMLDALSDADTAVARLAGDEFAVLTAGNGQVRDIEELCRRIIDLCGKALIVDEHELSITVSMGACIYSKDSHDSTTLLENADIAMYRAKAQGYNKYLIYDPLMRTEAVKAYEVEVLLKKCDFSKEFALFYQPQFSLPRQELIGAEALLRWKHPEHGYIPPNVFIPIAEKTDCIQKVGEWVMAEAFLQAKEWNRISGHPLKIGINLSPRQLMREGFLESIARFIERSGIDPAWIDLEITEGVMLSDIEKTGAALDWFKERKLSVSIDDFGSGYSSLGYLNKYSFDRIKLDKSLVDMILPNHLNGANVIKAAIKMAHAVGTVTIAEGVETLEQLRVLEAMGCDQVQGFLLGRPVPADTFERDYLLPGNKSVLIG